MEGGPKDLRLDVSRLEWVSFCVPGLGTIWMITSS